MCSLAAVPALVCFAAAATAAAPAWRPAEALFAVEPRPTDVALGARGRAIVAFNRESGFPLVIERAAAGLPWGLPESLPSPPSLLPTANYGPQVLLNRRGDALAWWGMEDLHTLVTVARRRDGTWSRAQPVGPIGRDALGYPSAFSLADDGRAWAIGVQCTAAGACSTRTLVSARQGAPWRPAGGDVPLPDLRPGGGTALAVAGGNAPVVWIPVGPRR
jgi:hypothetical protein